MIYVITFLLLLFIGIPIAFVIGITPFIKMLISGDIPHTIFPQQMFSGATIYMLFAIPFFIFAGNLMNTGGLTRRIVRFAQIFVGTVRGGLAMVNVIASMFFGGITGSANADTAALGSILIPAMKREGYDPEFSAAITVTSSTMGPIIPPSISMVLYAIMAQESVGTLFISGAIPGILIGVSLLIITYFIAQRRKYPKYERRLTFGEAVTALKDGILALLMPIIILGGILGGVFTPTEAAGVAVVYALIIGMFVYRELTLKKLLNVAFESAKLSAMLLLIVVMAKVLSWVFAAEQIPTSMANFMLALTNNKYLVLQRYIL